MASPSEESHATPTWLELGADVADTLPWLSPWSPGTIVDETYRIESELGRGGMGVVLLATDLVLQRRMALKVIHPEAVHPDFAARFTEEARAMATVDHPNVVTVHSFGVYGSLPYFAMQLVRGETLAAWMRREPLLERTGHAMSILDDVCRGVCALHHAGTVHRDIKPSNILLDRSGRAIVTDFGVSTRYQQDQAPRGGLAGTPAYMAPEVAFSDGHRGVVTTTSDVYSIACVAYQLLTGCLPVDGPNELALLAQHVVADVPLPTSLRTDLPRSFDRVLLDGLAKNPHQRTQSVESLRVALRDAWQRSLEPERILVAEDDRDFRDALELKLGVEFPNTQICCVENGILAMQAAEQGAPSIALLDLQMPELDGFATTRALRAHTECREIPILILTAAGGPAEWQRLRRVGADRFLVKPVDLDDVVLLMRRMLQQRSPAGERGATLIDQTGAEPRQR